jgi:hypothetical protein
MNRWSRASGPDTQQTAGGLPGTGERLLADGGHERDEDGAENANDSADAGEADSEVAEDVDAEEESDADPGETRDADPEDESGAGADGSSGLDHSNVEVTEAGTAEPADPKWEKPDPEDIPEVEGPKTRPADSTRRDASSGGKSAGMPGGPTAAGADVSGRQEHGGDPTAGMPNTARAPGSARLKGGAADGYVVALELCARLPADVRLPEEAADLVPVALEAELEQSVQQFAGEQFDNPAPHVETLDFVEVDDEIWLRLRLGVPPEAFADLDPDEVQEHALQKLDGML